MATPRRATAGRGVHLLAGLIGLALAATACSALTGPDILTAAEEAGVEVDDDTPLFDPRDTSEPLDPNGGVQSGNATGAGSTVTGKTVTENAVGTAALDRSVETAVGNWSTDWSRTTIDLRSLAPGLRGSDPRDGIPPIDRPLFETTAQASRWLANDEPGALVRVGDETRFYPLSILTRHEIVNDRFDDIPVAVTYCPLCNSAITFDRRVDGEVLRFGVSGLLRQSDLVMWDDATDSLWQQLTGEGIVGAFAGTRLDFLSTAIVSFEQFAADNPDGRSLSRVTGFSINYGSNPYRGYSSNDEPFGSFFQGEVDPRLDALARVVGVSVERDDGSIDEIAYPFDRFEDEPVVNDTIDGTPVVIWSAGDTTDALDGGTIANNDKIGTVLALDPVVDGRRLTFTAIAAESDQSGFTDDQTGSSWTVLGLATDGPLAGTQLETIDHRNEFWFAWAAFFPAGELRAS